MRSSESIYETSENALKMANIDQDDAHGRLIGILTEALRKAGADGMMVLPFNEYRRGDHVRI